jgi:epoxyqueuosine reductase QueG
MQNSKLSSLSAQSSAQRVPAHDEPGPATPRGHRNSAADWDFPFPRPGRPDKAKLPANTDKRLPWVDMTSWDNGVIEPRAKPSPISLADFKTHVLSIADDVGVISIDDPAIAHEVDEIRYIYPHARSLVVMVAEENKPSLQSRYLPTANHELYQTEEQLFSWGREVIGYIKSLGGQGLTTTVGWPQEVSVRWADKLWPLSHKLVAQAAGMGVIGTSRNFLHKRFGAYCLLDTIVTDLEFDAADYDRPEAWNPCLECNLCVAACPTEAIRADGEFDFLACYNHTYRDSIPGFIDFARDLSESNAKRFEKRWTDAEIAALWQSLAFRVEYRCFNCVAACPAEIHEEFHADREVRRDYIAETLRPLSYTRKQVEEQFVIDTPSAREKYGIPPGEFRTPPDLAKPGQGGVRLVQLQRNRVSNVDSMMRLMPFYFRSTEAGGLDCTVLFELSGNGGGEWTMRIASRRCQVEPRVPADSSAADLIIRCSAELFLKVHRGEASAVLALLLGRIRLQGDRALFLRFPALFPVWPGESWFHKLAWWGRLLWRSGLAAVGSGAEQKKVDR